MGLSYKGYNISLRPLKTDNQWQLELEKSGGEIVHTYTINPQKTLLSVEQFALDQVDKKVLEVQKSWLVVNQIRTLRAKLVALDVHQ